MFAMLIGFVSDERYVALPDVLLEFTNDRGESWEARSRASGSVYGHVPAGEYRVVLQKPGFGAKFSRVTLPADLPHQFRLLSDGLLGYALAEVGAIRGEVRVSRPFGRAVQARTVALRLGAGVHPRPRLA